MLWHGGTDGIAYNLEPKDLGKFGWFAWACKVPYPKIMKEAGRNPNDTVSGDKQPIYNQRKIWDHIQYKKNILCLHSFQLEFSVVFERTTETLAQGKTQRQQSVHLPSRKRGEFQHQFRGQLTHRRVNLLNVYGGVPKMVVPNNYGFSSWKWSFWGVLGVPPFNETPI